MYVSPDNSVHNTDVMHFLSSVQHSTIDLAIVDPPYNMKKADWDSFESHERFLKFSYEWIDLVIPTLKNTGSLYIFNLAFNCAYIMQYLVSKGMLFQNWITWDKRDAQGGATKKYGQSQETILFFTKTKQYTFNADDIRVPYRADTVTRKQGVLKNGKRWFPNPNGSLCRDVWHIASERHKTKVNGKTQKNEHIAKKPSELIERIIKASSKKNDLVLDPMCGSGTTAEAAKKLGRRFIVNDGDPHYARVTMEKLGLLNKLSKEDQLVLFAD